MLSMQVPFGRPLAGIAHHKVHDLQWPRFPLLPHQDHPAGASSPGSYRRHFRTRYFAPFTPATRRPRNSPPGTRCEWRMSWPIRRILSQRALPSSLWMVIPLGPPLLVVSSNLPVCDDGSPLPKQASAHTAWFCSRWGLPSQPGHPGCWWSLTPPFHPYLRNTSRRRSVFCGTSPRVTPGGC